LDLKSEGPDVLAWRHRPWFLWLIGLSVLAFAALMALGLKVKWRLECRREVPPAGAKTADGTGTCRVECGTILWSTVTAIPLSEVGSADLEGRTKAHEGVRNVEYRTVLRTARGTVPLEAWTTDQGEATEHLWLVKGFLTSPTAPRVGFGRDDRAIVWVLAGLGVCFGMPWVIFPRSAACVVDRRAGTLTVERPRLVGRLRSVHALADIRDVGFAEADPRKGGDRYRLLAVTAAGTRVPLCARPRRRDVLEPVVAELRGFLGLDARADPDLDAPPPLKL
jgi:hypothetical protein